MPPELDLAARAAIRVLRRRAPEEPKLPAAPAIRSLIYITSLEYSIMKFQSSEKLNEYMRERNGPTCLLAFSTGKDSIAAWLNLRNYYDRIIPVYMHLVPGLSFVEQSLDYYQDWFQTRIIRMPHPSLYRWLNALTFQAPENCKAIEGMRLPNFDYMDVFRIVKEDLDLPQHIYYGTGVRAADSPLRRLSMSTHGPVTDSQKKFHCVYDWNKERTISAIRRAGVKLSVDYQLFGRSFDGMDYRFLKLIKEHFPQDYQRILEFFPLAELEILKYQWRSEHV